jgi:hypothetical protein
MTHACTGHMASCDHCYLCDVVGVCCMTVETGQRAALEAAHRAGTSFWPGASIARDSLAAVGTLIEASETVSLPELIREEAEQRRQKLTSAARPALPAARTQSTSKIERRPHDGINRSDRKQ